MKTILITGSSGLVGSEAVKFFREKGWEVIGIDNNMRSTLFGTPKREIELELDIRNFKELEETFLSHKFNAIIHTAAQPSHDWSATDPRTDFFINAYGTLNLLEATRLHCPEATFVYVSTDKVYGENMNHESLNETPTRWNHEIPFDETLSLDETLRSPFGCSKLSGDLYTQEYGRYFGIKTACFRPGCITGRNHAGAEYHGFLAYLVQCIKEEKTYKIFGYKGKQVRDQIHAYDLVNAFWHFIQNPKIGAVYNIGGGPERSVSILEAIKTIEEKTGKEAVIEYVESPRKGDRIWDIHDVAKFKNDYPEWDYKFSLDDIFNDLCLNIA